MELNLLNHFKNFERGQVNPWDKYQPGTAFFRSGNMSGQVREQMDDMADKSELPRREFFKSALGFTGAMLAVNAATGMRFFDVSEAEAREYAALEEVQGAIKGKTGYVIDMHTHVCTRDEGYIEGVNNDHARHVVRRPARWSRQSVRHGERYLRHERRELRQNAARGQ